MDSTDTISPSFQTRKQKILEDLSVPDEEYTDLSPKGSVDVNIRPLIRDINGLPGLVTTSSCAGRISVFLEGGQGASEDDSGSNSLQRTGIEDGPSEERGQAERQGQFAPTGGKGSGKWLFVSHDPVSVDDEGRNKGTGLHELFGLTPGDGKLDADSMGQLRLVRFHFEPMVGTENTNMQTSVPELRTPSRSSTSCPLPCTTPNPSSRPLPVPGFAKAASRVCAPSPIPRPTPSLPSDRLVWHWNR